MSKLQRQLSLPQLHAPECREDFARQATALASTGHAAFETRHRRKDGTTFPVEISSRLVEIGGKRYQFGIIRDITQRKLHEAEIERVNRIYATLSQVNQAVVRCQTREELFRDICRVLIEFGQFRRVWIGWKEEADGAWTTAACRATGVDPALEMPGWKEGCGIIAEALQTGRSCWCNDVRTDPRTDGCRQVLCRLEVQTCAAFPLHLRGKVRGVLSLCSLEPGFFNTNETRLLEEVTADISFALDKIDKEVLRQEAEAKLRFTEFAMEHIADAVFWVNEAGHLEYVNAAACQALGYAREELLRLTVSDITVDFTLDAWPSHWQELKQAGWLFLEARHRAKEGRVFPVEIRANYMELMGRAFDCGFVRDITERKRAEEALRESEARYRELFAGMSSGVAVYEAIQHGEDFVIKDLNPAAEQITHTRREEVVGRLVSQVFPQVKLFGLFGVFQHVWQTGRPQPHPACLYQDERLSFWADNYVYRLPTGEVVAIFDDITERKRAEEQLRISETKYRRLHETMTDAFAEVDMAGHILGCNRAYREMLGYTIEELRQLTYQELTPETWHVFEAHLVAEEIMSKGSSGVYEKEYRRKDGTIFPVEMNTFLLRDEAGTAIGMWAIVRNITERKRAESKLTEQLDELRRWHDALVGREGRILELKRQVNELLVQSGRPIQYPSASFDASERRMDGFRPGATSQLTSDLTPAEPNKPTCMPEESSADGKKNL